MTVRGECSARRKPRAGECPKIGPARILDRAWISRLKGRGTVGASPRTRFGFGNWAIFKARALACQGRGEIIAQSEH